MANVGIDIVEIARFEKWMDYSYDQLLKVFSLEEISEFKILSSRESKKQFLASRFAVKEAFYKALCSFLSELQFDIEGLTFDKIRREIHVVKNKYEIPTLKVNFNSIESVLGFEIPSNKLSVSISHEKNYAVCIVLIFQDYP